ncbi:putative odorant receptor 69a isoform X2 [Drosophila sechellia]|uniref:putative odorant receptor 69a isoform X2 n=1 Tax=Drosophila sechellia TaxID=7238 RepID=UPI0013DE6A09|nr:putative odorant receptor 69a isoform X2 [Drosophila sechellia]
MQLHDHMKYIDLGCWMSCIPRYQWKGRPAERQLYASEQRIVFLLGSICQIYQIAGVLIYWYCNGRLATDNGTFVAQLSEMCSSFCITFVGFCNVYAISINRNQIETLLEELHHIYPICTKNHYRCQHYFDMAMRIMRIEFLFYMIFYVCYNSAPVLLLLWEHLHEGYDLSFKTQTNTWFPWKVHGSALGFGMAVLSITVGSFVGVGFSIVTQNLVCLLSFQLKLHYDGISSQLVSLDCRRPGAHKKLRILIAYHCRILQLGDQVNDILNFVFGSSLVGATIAICMSSVSILLLDFASTFKYVSSLVAFVLYNFVICYMGTEVTLAMQLEDFMRYQDLVCQAAQLPRYTWNGRRSLEVKRNLAKRIIFWLGAINLIYHNIGCVMYGYFVDGRTEDPIGYLAELASVASMLGFTIVGTLNLWKMLSLKTHFEHLLNEFEEVFQLTKHRAYRTHHYQEEYKRHIRNTLIFYTSAVAYYNSLPILLMIREHLSNSQQLGYRIQSSTWYPWRVQGSIPGFFAAVVCQIFSCQTNMCVNMFIQFLINFFGIQLEIHFDGLARQLETIDARNPHAKDQLKYLIVYHTKLLNLADGVNRSFNFTFLISLSVSMISTCFLAFSMTMFDFGTSLKHLVGLLLFITYNFSMCRSGTHLILTSDKVLPAAFYNNWYEGDLAYRRMLLILMMRATKPYMWRTYKLAPVSITTYMATLKFSYQMFTCVRSLK